MSGKIKWHEVSFKENLLRQLASKETRDNPPKSKEVLIPEKRILPSERLSKEILRLVQELKLEGGNQ